MIIQAMHGLGDNIYLRPVLKWLPRRKDIYIITPWPQVYVDLPNIKCVKPHNVELRTQKENAERADIRWASAFERPEYFLKYNMQREPPLRSFFRDLTGQQPTWVDNSYHPPTEWVEQAKLLIHTDKPVCLIRPNTLRNEWPCPARNCKNEYLQMFINMYRSKYYFISLANLSEGKESYEKQLVNVDLELTYTTIEQTIGLFMLAEVVICTPSFWLPLGAALNKRMLVIFGAGESYNQIHDGRLQNTNTFTVAPEPFEHCSVRKLISYKDIPKSILVQAFKEVVTR